MRFFLVGDLRLLDLFVGHAPDYALSLEHREQPFLALAGHTHGGQVQLPFFGPLWTLTDIPRVYADDFLPFGRGVLSVSRGIGMERGEAPRLRFLCRPELRLITLMPLAGGDPMILTVTPNPCVDKTVFIDALKPGTKIRSQRFACVAGGKGSNVSRAVKALGGDTAALVIVGGPTGRHVVDMLEENDGVRCVPVWVGGMTRTITTLLEEPEHRQTAVFEPGPALSEQETESVLHAFDQVLPEARVVTCNGAVQTPELRPLYRALIQRANAAGVKTILDSYGPEFVEGLEARPYMVKPNEEEAAQWLGQPVDSAASRRAALEAFHAAGVELAVLSLAAEGALVSRAGECLHAIPPAIGEVNPVGSGDALVAGFALGLHEGWSLERMARYGVAAGTANAMSWDIGHFDAGEVARIAGQVRVVSAG